MGQLALREDDPASWLNVYFRLLDDAKPVVKYNFCSADDTDRYPERNPTSWAIWCSADGETWRFLDERTNAFSPKSMLTWWNGSRPYSFGGEKPCDDMADEVNPFIGAVTQHPRSRLGGHGLGKTFPGAATPCGMIQLSPDTVTGGDNGCGYSYHHETIEGFSFTHLSGVGWYGDFGNFQVMPTTGKRILDRDKAKSPYSHEREVAEAGYYAVTLDRYGIRAEMSAAPRAGILRFTFPESKEARIQIDLGRRIGQLERWLKHSRQHVRVVDDHTIEGRMECPWEDGGWGHGHGRVRYVVNFTCAFSKPFKRFGVWDKDQVFEGCRDYTGTNTGFFAEFETAKDEQILVRAGLSYVDQEDARKNLASDIPDFDFGRVRRDARALWSDAFAGVKVKGGSVDDRVVFATCLYHALIDPRMIGDVDGRYKGSDGKIYRNERFTARTVFSGWDVFRSEMPLLTLIRPDIVNDTINSMLRWNELGPRETLPVWDIFGCTSSCMVGNPIIPCIADAYEKGIRNWDAETAWRLADNTSRRRGNAACGWTPNSISVTLEYAYDDWCMGKFAEMLGRRDDAKRYYERAGWYRNIWSAEAGWMRSRKADGSWAPWHGREKHGQGCAESNPWQQGWFVPHDVYGLMELMGGERKFADELESFFEKAPANFMWGDGYNHPNEVTHLVPFMFPYCGRPWLTQKWTRRICEGAYGNEVYGYVGNEDEGQMSAWYILAASGLHPACPGSGVWILTSPVFPEVSFRLDPKYANGGIFTIRANGVSKENVYIRSAKLNGKPLDRAWITTKEVSAGGLLELEMGAEPAFDAFPRRPPPCADGVGAGVFANPVWARSFPDPTTWRAEDGTWRATSTSRAILKSRDFLHWEDTGKSIFSKAETQRIRAKWKNIWAPDVFRLGDEYLLYVSLNNSAEDSAIAVYSSKDPEGPFSGGRIVTYSRDTGIRDTIDPEVVRDDRDGTLWLFFGSVGKMYRVRLAADGKSVASGAKYEHVAGLKANAARDPHRSKVFEGAYLHFRDGWWYLFASRGCYWNHTYAIVVGRARTLDGPFLDRRGRKMSEGFATTVLESKEGDRFFGPGHNGEVATIGGRDYIPYHCHVAGDNPAARPLFVSELVWDGQGWPSARSIEQETTNNKKEGEKRR